MLAELVFFRTWARQVSLYVKENGEVSYSIWITDTSLKQQVIHTSYDRKVIHPQSRDLFFISCFIRSSCFTYFLCLCAVTCLTNCTLTKETQQDSLIVLNQPHLHLLRNSFSMGFVPKKPESLQVDRCSWCREAQPLPTGETKYSVCSFTSFFANVTQFVVPDDCCSHWYLSIYR